MSLPSTSEDVMVDRLPLHTASNPTLDELWRGLATHRSRGAAVACVALGLAVVVGSRWAELAWIVTLAGIIVAAFGCDALAWSAAGGAARRRGRTHRLIGAAARVAAAAAAAAIALVVLGMIFGDKIEVMRR